MLARAEMRARDFGDAILGFARHVFDQQRRRHSTIRPRNEYLYKKQQHARYLWGKLKFRILKATRSLVKSEENEPLNARLTTRLMRALGSRYASHYWTLAAVRPRSVQAEVFPCWDLETAQLPSIAIVTPSFNQATLVNATIESVLGQDYPRLHYAVVDAGSTDGSVDAINAKKQHLAYYVSERDAGQGDAIRKGFRNISGEIMAYLNSDDLLMPGALWFVGELLCASFRR